MASREADFRRQLLATFRVEAAEHMQVLSAGLIELARATAGEARAGVIERLLRAAHSLKGAARAVGERDIERLCQEAEDAFSALQSSPIAVSKSVLDALHGTVDAIGERLQPGAGGKAAAQQQGLPAAEATVPADTVRIATSRLDALLYRAEELLAAKLGAVQHALDLRAAAKASPDSLQQRVNALARTADQQRRSLANLVDALLEDVKRALMLPAAPALEALPKMARDLAHDRAKEVELVLSGADIEIDRRILQEMRDPLVHLIRNCVDHGVEAPELRVRHGKPAQGQIRVALSRLGEGSVEIVVADDGAGIDAGKLAQAAVARGLATREEIEGKPRAQLLELAFHSGLSTSPSVTDLSGRGLGLAIVREKVERLGGSVAVDSQPGAGTTFRLKLPLALSTFRGVHVRAGDRRLVVPTTFVQQVLRVKRDELRTIAGRPTIKWAGQVLVAVPLAAALALDGKRFDPQGEHLTTLVARAGERSVALIVDEVLEESEVLVKPLPEPVAGLRGIAGVTLLASGEPVPVLELPDVIAAALKTPARPAEAVQPAPPRKVVLVAEDSITSRALLKAILESAGYEVAGVVDGLEALTLLRSRRVDLVVSDVEMPRMDGFALTKAMRADQALSPIPVVLVTALASAADRERGLDAGANAYIVKGSFDQSNLLEAVRQLL